MAPEDVLETTELTLVRVLRENGGAMGRHELERACLEAGMKRSSFNNRIAYSPVIEERGPGLYGLRAAAAPRERVGDEPGVSRRSTAARDARPVPRQPGALRAATAPLGPPRDLPDVSPPSP